MDDGEFIGDVKAVGGGEFIGDTKGVVGVEQVDVDDDEFISDVKAVVGGDERSDVDGSELIGDTKDVVGVEQVDVDDLIDDDTAVVGASEHADMVKSANALEHVGDADVDKPLSLDNFWRLNEGDSNSISSFSCSSVDTAGCIIDSLLTFLLVLLKYFVNTLFIFDI